MVSAYNFSVENQQGGFTSLSDFKGKVLLVVNSASRCRFTYQYQELQGLYNDFKADGLEILDFPCNQFGEQAPEDDDAYNSFCRVNFSVTFRQFHKTIVNGYEELPLFTWLKSRKGFKGFDEDDLQGQMLAKMFDEFGVPGWRDSSDIKWNFTKFLIDREGHVVERFEPSASADRMRPAIEALLRKA